MTDYTDVPAANVLHAESQQIVSAIANLDAGGTIINMMIGPPPYTPPDPGSPPVPMLMSVSIFVPPPVDPALTAQLRSWMDQRLLDISAELTALGVSVPPVTSMASAAAAQRGMSPLPQQPPMSVMTPPESPPTLPPPAITPQQPETKE